MNIQKLMGPQSIWRQSCSICSSCPEDHEQHYTCRGSWWSHRLEHQCIFNYSYLDDTDLNKLEYFECVTHSNNE